MDPTGVAAEIETEASYETPLPRLSATRPRTMIESEIVIVDADGTEDTFDPATWFSGSSRTE